MVYVPTFCIDEEPNWNMTNELSLGKPSSRIDKQEMEHYSPMALRELVP